MRSARFLLNLTVTLAVVPKSLKLVETPIYAINEGASPILSYNYGAKRPSRVRKSGIVMGTMILGYTAVMWGLIILAPGTLIRVFSSDHALVQDSISALKQYFAAFIFMDLQYIGQTTFKSLNKKKQAILKPMGQIAVQSAQSKKELVLYRHAPAFAPAGQSTQMIIGATPESDRHIMGLAESLYKKYSLKRVFFSAYLPVNSDSRLPALDVRPPLLREHRLYQADWLLRFYGFEADELLDEAHQSFNPLVDPKASWALSHMERFPIEVGKAQYEELLRVPGIGVTSAKRILEARRVGPISYDGLKKIGVVLKRAQYFITVNGKINDGLRITQDAILRSLISQQGMDYMRKQMQGSYQQLSLFSQSLIGGGEVYECLSGASQHMNMTVR